MSGSKCPTKKYSFQTHLKRIESVIKEAGSKTWRNFCCKNPAILWAQVLLSLKHGAPSYKACTLAIRTISLINLPFLKFFLMRGQIDWTMGRALALHMTNPSLIPDTSYSSPLSTDRNDPYVLREE